MNSALAHTFLYNIIIIFILIIFGFVMGTIVYYKSFKINKDMLSIIEKYEGYNDLSKKEINDTLKTIGYAVEPSTSCSARSGATRVYAGETTRYCVYYFPNDTSNGSANYYSYGVTTYITFDFPIVSTLIKIPIYTKSNRIYKFNDGKGAI